MAPREESNTLLLFSGYSQAKETHQVDVAVLLEDLCEGGVGLGGAVLAREGRVGGGPATSPGAHTLLALVHLVLLQQQESESSLMY